MNLHPFIVRKVSLVMLEAAQEVLRMYEDNYEISEKGNDNPVTSADISSENLLKEGLTKICPYPILSEESDDLSRLTSEHTWVIDPLDGTKDFIEKTGDFSIMVALLEKNETIAGFIYKPVSSEFWYGLKSHGAFKVAGHKKTQCFVSKEKDHKQQTILLSRFHVRAKEQELQKRLCIGNTITTGSAGLKMCCVAEGAAHVYMNTSSKTGEWDIAAGKVILEEAGGSITDLHGDDLAFNKQQSLNDKGFIASSGVNHAIIVETYRELS